MATIAIISANNKLNGITGIADKYIHLQKSYLLAMYSGYMQTTKKATAIILCILG
jgi:hypothetical protein